MSVQLFRSLENSLFPYSTKLQHTRSFPLAMKSYKKLLQNTHCTYKRTNSIFSLYLSVLRKYEHHDLADKLEKLFEKLQLIKTIVLPSNTNTPLSFSSHESVIFLLLELAVIKEKKDLIWCTLPSLNKQQIKKNIKTKNSLSYYNNEEMSMSLEHGEWRKSLEKWKYENRIKVLTDITTKIDTNTSQNHIKYFYTSPFKSRKRFSISTFQNPNGAKKTKIDENINANPNFSMTKNFLWKEKELIHHLDLQQKLSCKPFFSFLRIPLEKDGGKNQKNCICKSFFEELVRNE